MIRIEVSRRDLLTRIESKKEGWLTKAAERTTWLVDEERWTKEREGGPSVPNWSDIKDVWRELQGYNCAYCERSLPSESGKGEHDVEHYRPKGNGKGWSHDALDFAVKAGRAGGYPWLAYNPFNYCTSCKRCNSALKSDRFPLLSSAMELPNSGDATTLDRRAVTALRGEKPALPMPIGNIDTDPERLITFRGHFAIPVGTKNSQSWKRGAVTILFFKLNNDDMLRWRANKISQLWGWRSDPDKIAKHLAKPRTGYRGCGRAFEKVMIDDPARAQQLAQKAEELIT